MASAPEQIFDVRGKVALVTGGSTGIGKMMSQGLVRGGARVYISSRNAARCEEAARELSAAGPGECIALPADVAALEGCEALAAALARAEPRLDILINNSGTSWGQPLEAYPDKAWDKLMALNVKAPFHLTRALLPLLDAASVAAGGEPARVVNIGSIAGLQPQPVPTFAYDASKAAVHMVTRKLATELARRDGGARITVNAVAPGLVPSKMSDQLLTYVDEQTMADGIPLGRVGRPDDMAGVALFLCSRAGAWVTGAIIPVDGGVTASPYMPMMGSRL